MGADGEGADDIPPKHVWTPVGRRLANTNAKRHFLPKWAENSRKTVKNWGNTTSKVNREILVRLATKVEKQTIQQIAEKATTLPCRLAKGILRGLGLSSPPTHVQTDSAPTDSAVSVPPPDAATSGCLQAIFVCPILSPFYSRVAGNVQQRPFPVSVSVPQTVSSNPAFFEPEIQSYPRCS